MYRGRDFELITISLDKVESLGDSLELLRRGTSPPGTTCSRPEDRDALAEALDKEWNGPVPYTVLDRTWRRNRLPQTRSALIRWKSSAPSSSGWAARTAAARRHRLDVLTVPHLVQNRRPGLFHQILHVRIAHRASGEIPILRSPRGTGPETRPCSSRKCGSCPPCGSSGRAGCRRPLSSATRRAIRCCNCTSANMFMNAALYASLLRKRTFMLSRGTPSCSMIRHQMLCRQAGS